MKTNLSDLLASLPEDDRTPAELGQEQIQALFEDLSKRPVPVHSLYRFWTFGELALQVSLAYGALWFRQWFADADARQRQALETNLRVALKMVHRLGYLRGAAIKVGQMLGSLPDVLPEVVASTLDSLHAQAPPMHYSLLREMVRNELGKDPSEAFASFDQRPFAAASLGQVHRATLKTGQQVAVKIQYPGIARTIDADCRNLSALLFSQRLSKDWTALKAQFDEIHRMLKLEIDYEREAESMRSARTLFRPEEGIVVPEVYPEFSTRRVLTAEYIPGVHLAEFLSTNPHQSLRNAFGEKMVRVWYRMYYASMNHADPHSGNFVFIADGRLGLLDFGCVQHFSPEEEEMVRLVDRVYWGKENMTEFLRKVAGYTEKELADKELADKEYVSTVQALFDWFRRTTVAPESQPFDFGNEEHFKKGIELFGRLIARRYSRSHPVFLYTNRSILGFEFMLFRMRAQVRMAAIAQEEFASRKGAHENESE